MAADSEGGEGAAAGGEQLLPEQGGTEATEPWEVPGIEPQQEVEFFVDNSRLRSPAHGLGFRLSKLLEDKDGKSLAPWGSLVLAVDEGDGWVRVGTRYLPMELEGVPVLRVRVPLPTPARPPLAAVHRQGGAFFAPAGGRGGGAAGGGRGGPIYPLFAPSPVRPQAWRRASVEEASSPPYEEDACTFLVDNGRLQSPAHGLGFRLSKTLEDKDGNKLAFWGSLVTGVDEGDGWVRVGTRYLPLQLQGVAVLVNMGRARQVQPQSQPQLQPAGGHRATPWGGSSSSTATATMAPMGVPPRFARAGPCDVVASNLPEDITEEDVRELFEAQGALEDVHLTADGRWTQALLRYSDSTGSRGAVRCMHGLLYRNRTLHVKRWKGAEVSLEPSPAAAASVGGGDASPAPHRRQGSAARPGRGPAAAAQTEDLEKVPPAAAAAREGRAVEPDQEEKSPEASPSVDRDPASEAEPAQIHGYVVKRPRRPSFPHPGYRRPSEAATMDPGRPRPSKAPGRL